ncbi:MAG: DedA family protein [Pseudomonadota bacterium]
MTEPVSAITELVSEPAQLEPSTAEWIVQLAEDNMVLAEPLVFALGLGESIAFVSLLIPSTMRLLGIGGVHAAAGGQFWLVWLAGAGGAFIGDVLSFAVGRVYRDDLKTIWPLNRRRDLYVMTRNLARRRGMLGVIASKFAGTIRPFIPLMAGAAGMKWPQFLVASGVSCLMWSGVYLAPGYGALLLFSG